MLAPYVVLLVAVVFLVVPAMTGSAQLSVGNWFNIGQRVAFLALPAIGLAATMVAGEFDLSVPGSYLVGSVIAVKYGANQPLFWLLLSVVALAAAGAATGAVVSRFRVNSVCVTLGTYLAMSGAVYLISGDKSLSFNNYDIGLTLTQPVVGVLAVNVLIVASVVSALGVVMRWTRWGPQTRAVGSDRRSSRTVGIQPTLTLVSVFALSAALSGLAGALQGYALASAQPSTSTQLLGLAATCALIGGVSISGGVGTVLGVTCGVIALASIEEVLTRAQIDESRAATITGAVLLAVAIASAPELRHRTKQIVTSLRPDRQTPTREVQQ